MELTVQLISLDYLKVKFLIFYFRLLNLQQCVWLITIAFLWNKVRLIMFALIHLFCLYTPFFGRKLVGWLCWSHDFYWWLPHWVSWFIASWKQFNLRVLQWEYLWLLIDQKLNWFVTWLDWVHIGYLTIIVLFIKFLLHNLFVTV